MIRSFSLGRLGVAAGLLLFVVTSHAHSAVPAGQYRTSGECAGFPRVDLKTTPGFCVGLVATQLGFARGVAAIGPDIYVADMGGWRRHHGRVLHLAEGGHGKPETLLSDLDEPNGLIPGPKGSLYVGVLGKVLRFDPTAADPSRSLREVLVGLPDDGRHPLVAMAAAPDGTLFVNVGSATDHCEHIDGKAPDPLQPCPETVAKPPRGSILQFSPGVEAIDARGLKPYATGLRNSMALALTSGGGLVAATNARDFINLADPALSDQELPHEPFNLVKPGADYGWPYCFDDRRPSPEYQKYDCSAKQAPSLLLPAHAAPLGMLLYRGSLLAGLDGKLLIGYHGYRATGHRIVSLSLDGQGNPQGQPQEVVGEWGYAEGHHPQGAPVALSEMEDGSVLISEDHNGSLLRLAAVP